MKKTLLFVAAALTAGTMMAQTVVGLESKTKVHKTDITEYTGPARAELRTASEGDAPASIIGKSYVTYFGSFTNYVSCAGNFTVEQATGDTVVLKNILGDYDLKGVYDKTTGTVTVPTGQVVGQYSTYGDVTAYTLLAPGFTQYSSVEPCVMTFTNEGVTLNNGFYASCSAGGMSMMKDIKVVEANGSMKFDQYNSAGTKVASHDYPVYFKEVTDSKMVVNGFANWMYQHDYNVDFNIEGTTATLPITCPIDWYTSSSAGTLTFYLLSHASNGVSPNPTFTYAKDAKGNITLTADSNLFWGYEKTSGSWSGYFLRNMVLNYTAPATSGVKDIVVENENAPVEYYNLQGVKIAEPAQGTIVIRRQGSKATKVLVK